MSENEWKKRGALCLGCGDNWTASVPDGVGTLECPGCGEMKGETYENLFRLRAELGQARLKEIGLFQTVMEVTAEHCKCGGSGPDDPKACDACKIYHALRPHFSEEAAQ